MKYTRVLQQQSSRVARHHDNLAIDIGLGGSYCDAGGAKGKVVVRGVSADLLSEHLHCMVEG